jgi:hypothetical protein
VNDSVVDEPCVACATGGTKATVVADDADGTAMPATVAAPVTSVASCTPTESASAYANTRSCGSAVVGCTVKAALPSEAVAVPLARQLVDADANGDAHHRTGPEKGVPSAHVAFTVRATLLLSGPWAAGGTKATAVPMPPTAGLLVTTTGYVGVDSVT